MKGVRRRSRWMSRTVFCRTRRIGWPSACSIPRNSPIDGIVLGETPHRNKVIPYSAGSSYNHGGIVDSVELLVVPACTSRTFCAAGREDRTRYGFP